MSQNGRCIWTSTTKYCKAFGLLYLWSRATNSQISIFFVQSTSDSLSLVAEVTSSAAILSLFLDVKEHLESECMDNKLSAINEEQVMGKKIMDSLKVSWAINQSF